MPPKGAQKSKAQATPHPTAKVPATPDVKPKAKPTAVAKASPTSKKPKEVVVWKSVPHDQTLPIDAAFEGETALSKVRKAGDYGHTLKLIAPNAFTLVKAVPVTEGDYQGCLAIYVRPAKPFPFLKLPKEARKRIYDFYFAAKGIVGDEIIVESKRIGKDSKDMYSKAYADGSKNRVGLLAVNKEIYDEAVQVFYAHKIHFQTTSTMQDFLTQMNPASRKRITDVKVDAYVKTTSRNAMMLLAEAGNISKLHVGGGVFGDKDANKAAKAFYLDAYKLLGAISSAKGSKEAAVDAVTFGPNALTYKDNKEKVRPWPDETVEQFREALLAKLNNGFLTTGVVNGAISWHSLKFTEEPGDSNSSGRFSRWVCVCGTLVKGHSCSGVFAKKADINTDWMHIGHGGAAMLAAL